MANEFKCPACSASMSYDGGDSIFQTCAKCHAPIVIPSEIFYTKEQQIDAEDFATLTNDKSVSEKQISLDVGAGEVSNDDQIEEIISNSVGSGAENIISRIENELENGNKIDAVKLFYEYFNVDLAESKEIIEALQSGRKVDISGFRRR